MLPLHLAMDAQGPMGIMDASGRAVVWLSEYFTPTKGYVWEPEEGEQKPDPDTKTKTTAYSQRNAIVRAIFSELLIKL